MAVAGPLDRAYEDLCARSGVYPMQQVRRRKEESELAVTTDRFGVMDWPPLLMALEQDSRLRRVSFVSSHFWREKNFLRTALAARAAGGRALRESIPGPAAHLPECRMDLCRSLATLCTHSEVLTTLELTGLPFSAPDMAVLSEGLIYARGLSFLAVRKCKLGDTGFAALARGIQGAPALVAVDVSANLLTPASVPTIASILKFRAQQAGTQLWEQSLRGRTPSPATILGLRIWNLSDNRGVGDDGAAALAGLLAEDMWTHAIFLLRCGIGARGAAALVDAMAGNCHVTRIAVGGKGAALRQLAQLNEQRVDRFARLCEERLPSGIDVIGGLRAARVAHAMRPRQRVQPALPPGPPPPWCPPGKHIVRDRPTRRPPAPSSPVPSDLPSRQSSLRSSAESPTSILDQSLNKLDEFDDTADELDNSDGEDEDLRQIERALAQLSQRLSTIEANSKQPPAAHTRAPPLASRQELAPPRPW
eukprot:m.116377 g.116377  ORF g.116377 m.116377 type:complete len:477 (-) comp9182_c0_seq1:94-1524(-)